MLLLPAYSNLQLFGLVGLRVLTLMHVRSCCATTHGRCRWASTSSCPRDPTCRPIPSIALRQVEVRRDGVAAQYGSDAIASIMNFQLKGRPASDAVFDDASLGERVLRRKGPALQGPTPPTLFFRADSRRPLRKGLDRQKENPLCHLPLGLSLLTPPAIINLHDGVICGGGLDALRRCEPWIRVGLLVLRWLLRQPWD